MSIVVTAFVIQLSIAIVAFVLREEVSHLQHTGWAKKLHTVFMAITLSTLNHFS